MKKILALVLVALPLLFARPVHAMEGTATLSPVAGSTATCFVASIYRGQYQAMGSCRNLPTAFSAERTRFYVWFQDEAGNWMPMGEVDHGKFQFTSGTRFVAVEITAEISPAPRQPSTYVLARGVMNELTFANTVTPAPTAFLTPTLTITTTPGGIIIPTPTPATGAATTLANLLKTIGKIVGIGFIVLLILVVVMTLVTRRRENNA